MRSRLCLPILFSALGLVLFLVGCGTLNHMQYEIRPVVSVSGRTILSAVDTNAVKEILGRSATRLKLEERTPASMVPGTIIYFLSPDNSTPIKLLAWMKDGKVIVDLMHAPDEVGEDLAYRDEKDRLFNNLVAKFGSRAVIVPMRQQSTVGTQYER